MGKSSYHWLLGCIICKLTKEYNSCIDGIRKCCADLTLTFSLLEETFALVQSIIPVAVGFTLRGVAYSVATFSYFSHFHIVLISLDNDQLSVILIATITASAIRSDSDGASIVFIISLPTSRSRARIRPFPTNRFIPSSSFVCSSGDLLNSFRYIINPRITDIAITTPAATSMPSVRY